MKSSRGFWIGRRGARRGPIEASNQKSRANLHRGLRIVQGVVVACGIGVAYMAPVLRDPMFAGFGLLLIVAGVAPLRHRRLQGAITLVLVLYMSIDIFFVPNLGLGLYM